jgi:hypothetical protein
MNWKITLLKVLSKNKYSNFQAQVEFNPNQPKDESPICVTSGALLLHLVWNFFGKKWGDNALWRICHFLCRRPLLGACTIGVGNVT